MAVPGDREARLFYRAAEERLAEAGVLLAAGHPTGAVYLAGYAVECGWKALLLASVPAGKRAAVRATFRGNAGHDLRGLRRRYAAGNPPPPGEVQAALDITQDWETPLSYEPARYDRRDAAAFVAAARQIFDWIDGRTT